MKKNLLLSILFLLAVPLVFVPAESKGADTTPPTFEGLQWAVHLPDGETIWLNWYEATDESPPITYNIYWSTSVGGLDFANPNATTTDPDHYDVYGLEYNVEYYFVVRAEDSFGNEDTNFNWWVAMAYHPDDDDYDGYTPAEGDCDDGKAWINPGAVENCNDQIDNDCDNLIDAQDPDCGGATTTTTTTTTTSTTTTTTTTIPVDADDDGYDATVDCNDGDPNINPGAVEDCTDLIDNDCDNLIDAQDPDAVGCLPICTDGDGDTYNVETQDCGAIDCNDSDASINPGAVEDCTDSIDNDCDNNTDCADSECIGDPACQGTVCSDYTSKAACNEDLNCEWSGSPKNGTCQDAAVCVPDQTPEVTCTDGVDNDCDGLTDCADTADCGADPACQGGSCDTYIDKTSCQSNGCTWDNRAKVCM